MKEVITVTTIDNSTITIFTKYIAYIEHSQQGCVIHINAGGENVGVATAFKWAEMVNLLALK
ncbi:MAG: hypothetical protein JO072_02695 [Parafilimonas sp.]|nr:hypothetical protein [Parafilimonas sp.]